MQKHITITLVTLLIGFSIFSGLRIDSLKNQLSEAYNSKTGKAVRTIIKGGATFEGAKRVITGKF